MLVCPDRSMALPSLIKCVVICVIVLGHVSSSLQNCRSNFIFSGIPEGPETQDYELYNSSSVLGLRLTDNGNGYLGVSSNTSNGSTTWKLSLLKEVDLEVLQKDEISGNLICTDQNGSSRFKVLLPVSPVNEFAPEFIDPPFNATVPEDTSPGTTIFSFANRVKDVDYSSRQIFIFNILNNSSPFIIGNGGSVIVNETLDFDSGPSNYFLTVSAQEVTTQPKSNSTTLNITIADIDDLGPIFYNSSNIYTLGLAEGEYSGDIFQTQPQLIAKDGDTLNDAIQLQLDITSQSFDDKITILPNGSINVTGTFTPGQFTFNVRAFQKNRPADRFAIARVMVTVFDINDHDPIMSSSAYRGNVIESAAPGTVVLVLSASDEDQGVNSSFLFYLKDIGMPFNISTDHTIGIIRVKDPLDRETNQSYILHVYAEEDQSTAKKRSNVSQVTITVLDVNDNTPVFQGSPYNFTLNETDVAGYIVGHVNATDPDTGNNGIILFRITNDAQLIFAVDPSSGIITLKRNLTQNDVGVFSLDLRAENEDGTGKVQRSESTRVTITVLAVNQYSPVFTEQSYNFTVPETVLIGHDLGIISATDGDGDTLNYSLVNARNEFRLQGHPPSLLVNTSLDLDAADSMPPKHEFVVVATDGLFEVNTSVTVFVTMVNEYAPAMGLSTYIVNVPENTTFNSEILLINATDADKGPDGKITFMITSSSTNSGPFLLNSSSGVLSYTNGLDFETRQQYTLVVKTVDGGSPSRYAVSPVIINVIDVNNKAPYFTIPLTGSVSESVKKGTTVLQLQTDDPDTPNAELTYSMQNVYPGGWLALNGTSILTNDSLNAEFFPFITATVIVSDGVHDTNASLNITILDFNDNGPEIILTNSTVDVPENAPVGTPVLKVGAKDQDISHHAGFLFYLGPSPSGKFAINSSSGQITVAAPFDRRIQTEYNVTISVSDNSAPPLMNSTILHVIITDSNTAPNFVDSSNVTVSMYSFHVNESLDIGQMLGQIKALDPDSGSSGQIHYSIWSGNDDGKFQLDDNSGTILLQQKLDYEQTASYSLVVNATDNSFQPKWTTATVTITVVDVIEAPQWPDNLPVVPLTTSDPCTDVQLGARPRDILQTSSSSQSDVVYSLLNYTDTFSINNETGLLQSTGSLHIGTYHIGLHACSVLDILKCSDAVLTIQVSAGDIISFCPPFFTVHVNESVGAGHLVVDMNSTKGDRNVTYNLKDAATPFSLNQTTGVLMVHGILDREKRSQYTLEIDALYLPSNGTATAQVTVVVDDSDDTPPSFVFRRYEGEISEGAIAGAPVFSVGTTSPLKVAANDRDLNPKLTFFILPSEDNSQGSFTVNSSTGVITLLGDIDRENMTASLNGQYQFTVIVSDGYFNDSTTVTVQIMNENDNSPIFYPDVLNFNVSEAKVPPYEVAKLTAKDKDPGDSATLQYNILASSEVLPFSVSTLGVLQLTTQLDRETLSFYSFTVVATDSGGNNGTAQVNINVSDANDPPQFNESTYTFNITEGPESMGSQLVISASENDTESFAILTYDIESGNDNGYFAINTFANSTGMILVVKELDREMVSTITLIVTATDNGEPPLVATCTVEVVLEDVNDNDPAFGSSVYRAEISEGAANNTQLQLIPALSVSDGDEGIHGKQGLIYSLESNFPSVPFRVDPKTGYLFVFFFNDTENLDRETVAIYTLMMVATDNEGAGLSGNATVVISLTNVNDDSPSFSLPHYSFTVSENASLSFVITTLNATDSDTDSGLLRFYIYPPAGNGKFYLNPVTGELQVAGSLDRETQDHYTLWIGVYDGLFWGNTTVNITVEDVNDNCPVFNNDQPLTLYVKENENLQVIHTFNVTDHDIGSNANVNLSMSNSVPASLYLRLDPDGNLSTMQTLNREKDDQQILGFTVSATDAGSPPCSSSLYVQVVVLGANDNQPFVCQITRQQQPLCDRNISVTAFDQASEGTFLAALTWSDADVGEGGEATLSLSHNPDDLLILNNTSPTTSILSLAKTLDRSDLFAKGLLGDDNATFSAEVTATDKGPQSKNSSVVITLTVKELLPSSPVFSSSVYRFTIMENQPSTVIGRVRAAAQTEGLQINYKVEATSDFSIDSLGNVSTLQQLDRERADMHTFLVLAWESSHLSETATSVVLVTVLDQNDNTPRFSDSVFDVMVQEERSDIKLLNLTATDNDAGENGAVGFTLLNTSLSDVFLLNAKSGVLSLNRSLDRETQSSYILLVEAVDGGTPHKTAQAIVNITVLDLNDNSPVFTQDVYVGYLDEKSPALTLVKNVSATDIDSGLNGQVLYQFLSSGRPDSESVPFYINEFSGAIFTSRSLNYQMEQSFNLTVIAQDLGTPTKTSSASVRVLINDLSLVLPQLVFDPERVVLVVGTPASTVLPVNVTGGFGNYNFSIIAGNEGNHFSMDKDSGVMTIIKELTSSTTYQLSIRAYNLEATKYYTDETLKVVVTTVQMEQEHYAAVVPENQKPPFLLLDVNCNAERAGIPVTYQLQGDGITDIFTVEQDTGQVSCIKSLDREEKSEYMMQVLVGLTDVPTAGRKRRSVSNEANIRIIVDDVNDNVPKFDIASYIFGIPASAAANTLVTTLEAVDLDSGPRGKILYKSTGGNTDVFSVTSEGQVLSLVSMAEKPGELFKLAVNATDNNGVCGSSSTDVTCQSTGIEIMIVVVADTDRFGLVANISMTEFTNNQQNYLRNMSDILDFTIQLDKVEPYQDKAVDTSKSNIYFYAFDSSGKPVPFATINEKVKDNIAAINALFKMNARNIQVIPVTEPPTRVEIKYRMGEAEIAVIIVACLIFLVSFIAVILTIRAWRKQKDLQEREEAAARARQELEQETKELADKLQETSFVADPEEPLELDMDPDDEGRVFNPRMFLKNMRESEHRQPACVEMEDQEFVITFGNESRGVDTVALRQSLKCEIQFPQIDTLVENLQRNQNNAEVDSGLENNNGSLSSEEHQQNNTQPGELSTPLIGESSTDYSPGLSVSVLNPAIDYVSATASKSRHSSPDYVNVKETDNGLETEVNGDHTDDSKDSYEISHLESSMHIHERISPESNYSTFSNGGVGSSAARQTESPTDTAEIEANRLDDPEPDYQKRVSFSEVLDTKEDDLKDKDRVDGRLLGQPQLDYLSATSRLLDTLKAKKSEGVVNPVFYGDEALDGWAEDYENQSRFIGNMSTAL